MLHDELQPNVEPIVDAPTDTILSDIPSSIDVEDTNTTIANTSTIPIPAIDIVHEMALLFAGDLNPVAPKAQRKVQIPEDLNLDEWINLPPADSSSSSDDEHTDLFVAAGNDERRSDKHRRAEPSSEELQKVCHAALLFFWYVCLC